MPSDLSSALPRRVLPLLIAAVMLVVGLVTLDTTRAQDDAPQPAADRSQSETVKQMLGRVQNMEVHFPQGDSARTAELHPTPLIHYSDQVRNLPESTLWVWQLDQAPVMFCKVERLISKPDKKISWQYCCVPAAEEKSDVVWKRDFRWRSKEVGFKWQQVAEMPQPHQQEGIRLTQLRNIARGFTGEVTGSQETGTQQSRLLPRPLHRFSAPKANIVDGAVFGLTSNGTNPDVILIVEGLQKPVADSYWRYAVIGMTGDAVEVRFKDKAVWNKPVTVGPGDHKSWMWYVSTQ